MRPDNSISYGVGISMFRFGKYYQRVFGLMYLNINPNSKTISSEIIDAKKNKSYYQWYSVTILRYFHNQKVTKQNI